MDTSNGFPVIYDTSEPRLHLCRLCVDMFRTDSRGTPVLTHPELGAIVVCYTCAEALQPTASDQQTASTS
jgi:hypothetical protein